MRPVLLACSIFAGVAALACPSLTRTDVQDMRPATVAAADTVAPSPPRKQGKERTQPVIEVRGSVKAYQDHAELDALVRTQIELEKYLRKLDPPVWWSPPVEFIRAKARLTVTDVEITDPDYQQFLSDAGKEVGEINSPKRAVVEIALTPAVRREMLYLARQDRSENRLLLLAPLLAGLVLLLMTVGAYIQLDEQTKGYYTGWLRVAALGMIAAVVGSGLWWFRHTVN